MQLGRQGDEWRGTCPVERPRVETTVISRADMSERCGCQGKLPGAELSELLSAVFPGVPGPKTPSVREPEDCAVVPFQGGDMLLTNDLGPLVGCDLFRAGKIATVHALSDVYAVGGTPRWALVSLIIDRDLPPGSGAAVLRGIFTGCREDSVEVVGGQTLVGPEAMAGLSVIGQANGKVLAKRGAHPGDSLMLSKPLGVGLVVRGYRLGLLDETELEAALRTMETSNRQASRAALQAGARAATDVTGFGLLGHLAEMIAPCGLGATIHLQRVPVLDAARRLPPTVAHTAWIEDNLNYVRSLCRLTGVLGVEDAGVLLDPQTSGGLLVAVNPREAGQLERYGFVEIGTITEQPGAEIVR